MAFTWWVNRDGYSWRGPPEKRELIPVKGQRGFKEYVPLADYSGLFLRFAETEPTEEGIIAFAHQFGPHGLGTSKGFKIESCKFFSAWVGQIAAMRDAVSKWRSLQGNAGSEKKYAELSKAVNKCLFDSSMSRQFGNQLMPKMTRYKSMLLELKIEAPPLLEVIMAARNGTAHLEMEPGNLCFALWAQFALAIVGNKQFRQCPSCKSWFEISPEERRADAQYCREACRVSAYKIRKKKALALAKEGKSAIELAKEFDTTPKIINRWIASAKRQPTPAPNCPPDVS